MSDQDLSGTMTTGTPDWMKDRDKWTKFLRQHQGRMHMDEEYFEILFDIEKELGMDSQNIDMMDQQYRQQITDFVMEKLEPIRQKQQQHREELKYGWSPSAAKQGQ